MAASHSTIFCLSSSETLHDHPSPNEINWSETIYIFKHSFIQSNSNVVLRAICFCSLPFLFCSLMIETFYFPVIKVNKNNEMKLESTTRMRIPPKITTYCTPYTETYDRVYLCKRITYSLWDDSCFATLTFIAFNWLKFQDIGYSEENVSEIIVDFFSR